MNHQDITIMGESHMSGGGYGYTTARIVKGNQVIIGPGCNIETVEYQDSLEVDSNSTVKNQVKVG